MSEASESFMVYIKISMITAAALASPWLIYQVWQFVAAGLYPHERKYITKYLPLSITLLVAGMTFLYFFVLPLMLKFFLAFNIGLPLRFPTRVDASAHNELPITLPILNGDPARLTPGTQYFDASQGRLKFIIGTPDNPQIRVIPYGSADIVSPHITLSAYIDMVVEMLLSFGLAFQMPLVVLALVRIGIVDIPTLKKARRYVYFGMSIVAAVIVPDVVGGMIALMIPLILLFEMGLWLAREPKKPVAAT
jgi:Sec-independent protein secretion pathway component TatC